jgi:hypothetical protein
MREDQYRVEEWIRAWTGFPLDDEEVGPLADACSALRERLDAIADEELRDIEPPLWFQAHASPR